MQRHPNNPTGCYYDEPHYARQNHPDIVDLPAWFKNHGYYTAVGGKLYHHVPSLIDTRGWDYYFHWDPETKKKGWGLMSWEAPAPLPEYVSFSSVVEKMTGKPRVRVADAPRRPKVEFDDLPPSAMKKSIARKKHVHDQVIAVKARKNAVQGYLAALSYADAMVGRVLDAPSVCLTPIQHSSRSQDCWPTKRTKACRWLSF